MNTSIRKPKKDTDAYNFLECHQMKEYRKNKRTRKRLRYWENFEGATELVSKKKKELEKLFQS